MASLCVACSGGPKFCCHCSFYPRIQAVPFASPAVRPQAFLPPPRASYPAPESTEGAECPSPRTGFTGCCWAQMPDSTSRGADRLPQERTSWRRVGVSGPGHRAEASAPRPDLPFLQHLLFGSGYFTLAGSATCPLQAQGWASRRMQQGALHG